MVNVIRSEKRLKILWVLVIIASCVLSIGAVNDYRSGRLALGGIRIQGMIGGLFDNPNDLALHLVTMIPLALAMMLSSRNPLSKLILLGCTILLLGGVVATFSLRRLSRTCVRLGRVYVEDCEAKSFHCNRRSESWPHSLCGCGPWGLWQPDFKYRGRICTG